MSSSEFTRKLPAGHYDDHRLRVPHRGKAVCMEDFWVGRTPAHLNDIRWKYPCRRQYSRVRNHPSPGQSLATSPRITHHAGRKAGTGSLLTCTAL